MKKIVQFKLDSDSDETIEVEVQSTDSGNISAGVGGIAEKAEKTFESALSKIRPVANAVVAQVVGMAKRPDSVSVEFGIKFSAKAGVIIASADSEANLKVTLSWKVGEAPAAAK